jgi:SAM-dependent methyltransferase
VLIANFGSGHRDLNAGQIEQLWPGATVTTIDSDPTSEADFPDDLRQIGLPGNYFDGGLCSHVLEHFCEADVSIVLAEFRRVLKVGAKLIVVVPNLLQVCRLIATGRLMQTAYQAPIGPIRPIDVLYGYQGEVQAHPLMAHRFGFDAASLLKALRAAGFSAQVHADTLHLIGEGIANDRASDQDGDPGRKANDGLHRGAGNGDLPAARVGTLWTPGMPLVASSPPALDRSGRRGTAVK